MVWHLVSLLTCSGCKSSSHTSFILCTLLLTTHFLDIMFYQAAAAGCEGQTGEIMTLQVHSESLLNCRDTLLNLSFVDRRRALCFLYGPPSHSGPVLNLDEDGKKLLFLFFSEPILNVECEGQGASREERCWD